MATGVNPTVAQARADRKSKAFRYWDTVGSFYPSDVRKRKVASYTDLAKKYSHPIGQWLRIADNRILRNTGKSGLTPLPPLDPNEMITKAIAAQRAKRNEYEIYQRRRLGGFTPAELESIGALAPLIGEEMKGGLTIDIHPIFGKKWWMVEADLPKHMGLIPMLGDNDGFWTGQNPIVWNVLEPCLKLATVIITSLNTYPWLDAVFKGPLTPYTGTDPQGQGNWVINERPIVDRSTDAESTDLHNQLNNAAGRVRFGFRNNHTGIVNGIENGLELATTATKFLPNIRHAVFLSVEQVQPLLRTGLNDAERLLAQMYVAHIILHELGHISWQLVREKRQVTDKRLYNDMKEPYFANEEYCELGFSFVDKIFGGEPTPMHQQPFHRGGPGLPSLGLNRQDWFEYRHARAEDARQRQIAQSSSAPAPVSATQPCYDSYPLPMTWLHSLFQSASWDVVYKKTGIIPNMGPLTLGTRIFGMNDPNRPEWLGYITAGDRNKISSALQIMGLDPVSAAAYDLAYLLQVDDIYKKLGMTPAERAQLNYSKASLTATGGKVQADLTFDRFDTLPDEEEIPLWETSSPRYSEIKAYFFANRAPLELALDTMDILPFPAFYRYIRERGGIDLSAMELWHFLGEATLRRELFILNPYPGPGLVIHILAGWPPANPLAARDIPPPAYTATPAQKDALMDLIRRPNFREYLVKTMLLEREMPFEVLRSTLATLYKYQVRAVPFKAVVIACVRESWGFNTEFTLGPEGIVRFTFDLTPVHAQFSPQLLRDELAKFELLRNQVDDEWRRKQAGGT